MTFNFKGGRCCDCSDDGGNSPNGSGGGRDSSFTSECPAGNPNCGCPAGFPDCTSQDCLHLGQGNFFGNFGTVRLTADVMISFQNRPFSNSDGSGLYSGSGTMHYEWEFSPTPNNSTNTPGGGSSRRGLYAGVGSIEAGNNPSLTGSLQSSASGNPPGQVEFDNFPLPRMIFTAYLGCRDGVTVAAGAFAIVYYRDFGTAQDTSNLQLYLLGQDNTVAAFRSTTNFSAVPYKDSSFIEGVLQSNEDPSPPDKEAQAATEVARFFDGDASLTLPAVSTIQRVDNQEDGPLSQTNPPTNLSYTLPSEVTVDTNV